MIILGQRDDRWGNLYLGTSNTKIRDFGCTITCLAMIIGTTPDVVNDRMKAVGGFANGNLVIWSKIEEAFPGIKIKRVWTYDNTDVKNNVPNVLVEVPPNAIGGVSGKHWVVFIGNQECNDPWTASKRPTNDFLKYGAATGYCVVTGKWNQPTPPASSDTIAVLKTDFEKLVKNSTEYDKFVALGYTSADTITKATDSLRNDLNDKDNELASISSQLTNCLNKEPVIKEVVKEVEKIIYKDKIVPAIDLKKLSFSKRLKLLFS